MRLLPYEIAIGILGDEFEPGIFPDSDSAFDGKAGALEYLQNLTEEDFGYDCAKWRNWFDKCPRDLFELCHDNWYRKELVRTRPERLAYAEDRWGKTTHRRCPNCNGLCPEYRNHCWVCEAEIGRVKSEPENNA